MTKPEKLKARKAIARDALRQIEKKKYRAAEMAYTRFALMKHRESIVGDVLGLDWKMDGKQVQKRFLRQSFPACEVCVKGALLLSRIRCFGGLDFAETIAHWGSEPSTALTDIFSQSQLDWMERIYEGYGPYAGPYSRIKSRRGRLIAILRKVADCGEFDPDTLPKKKVAAR